MCTLTFGRADVGASWWIVKDYRVTSLADAVLPLIRTRADLYRWSLANAHGRDMHEAVDLLEAALPTIDPVEAHRVTERALTSALKVLARADDSSGVIGDACHRLSPCTRPRRPLHPTTAAAARVPVGKLVDWMMAFQFDGIVDYFELDVVDYARPSATSVFGPTGQGWMRMPQGWVRGPAQPVSWSSKHAGEWFTLDWNAWLEDAAYALDEIGERELARGKCSRWGRAAERWFGLEWHPLSELNPAAATASRPAVLVPFAQNGSGPWSVGTMRMPTMALVSSKATRPTSSPPSQRSTVAPMTVPMTRSSASSGVPSCSSTRVPSKPSNSPTMPSATTQVSPINCGVNCSRTRG